MINLHILGGSHPCANYLIKLNNRENKIYLYTSKSDKFKSTNNIFYYYYEEINNFVSNHDIIISFSPIKLAAKIIENIYINNIFPRKIILLSSSSIYSKVNNSSIDREQYIHFLEGENHIKLLSSSYKEKSSIAILRPTMIWGDYLDKNIHRVFLMFSQYRFFPISSKSNGKRSPIHYEDLSNLINRLTYYPFSFFDIYDVHGSEVISFKRLVKIIQESKKLSRTYILVIPNFLLLFLNKIIYYLPNFQIFNNIKSSIGALIRQSSDLVYFNNDINKIIPDFEVLTFLNRIRKTYKD